MRRQDIEYLARLLQPDSMGAKVATGGTAVPTSAVMQGAAEMLVYGTAVKFR